MHSNFHTFVERQGLINCILSVKSDKIYKGKLDYKSPRHNL